MGKNSKKQRHQQKPSVRQRNSYLASDDVNFDFIDNHPSSIFLSNDGDEEENDEEIEEHEETNPEIQTSNKSLILSKFSLYQQSVQSPKGDISYLLKFFLITEWLRTDPRRTAIGLDFDLEALKWCMENNFENVGSDNSSRISLFHGNVLKPCEARLVKSNPEDLIQKVTINECKHVTQDTPAEVSLTSVESDFTLPSATRDIVCAFNYSCCCLHKRKELVLYFKHALGCLSKKGGIFVMDLYGGTSSERKLKLQRKFPNFTYTWEQAEFDVVQRKTRISLHYQLHKPQKKIRNAFSYSWRLWSLPEIRDCLEEAGFRTIHFWVREMPDTERNRSTQGFGTSRDDKYEEASSFQQEDAWNAYVVAVV